jgi:hypothetical protein
VAVACQIGPGSGGEAGLGGGGAGEAERDAAPFDPEVAALEADASRNPMKKTVVALDGLVGDKKKRSGSYSDEQGSLKTDEQEERFVQY